MTPFEEELKRALVRCEPPADFTERVLAQVSAAAPKRGWYAVRGWQLVAIAAMALVMLGTIFQQQRSRARQGEQAKEKLLVAMRITGWKLQQAQEHVQRVENMEVNQ